MQGHAIKTWNKHKIMSDEGKLNNLFREFLKLNFIKHRHLVDFACDCTYLTVNSSKLIMILFCLISQNFTQCSSQNDTHGHNHNQRIKLARFLNICHPECYCIIYFLW